MPTKNLIQSCILLCALLPFAGCSGGYNDPQTGERKVWEMPDNPTQQQKQEAFDFLERLLALHADELKKGVTDAAKFQWLAAQIEEIARGKQELGLVTGGGKSADETGTTEVR